MGQMDKSMRFLVVEDEQPLALEWIRAFEERGAGTIGPAASVEQALGLLKTAGRPDGAIIDIELGSDLAYPVADALNGYDIPFVFASARDRSHLPKQFESTLHYKKPVAHAEVVEILLQESQRRNIERHAAVLAAMANPSRLAVLDLLFDTELPVTIIADRIGLSQSSLSQHLAILRAQKLVTTRRNAQTIYYSSRSRIVAEILSVLAGALREDEDEAFLDNQMGRHPRMAKLG